jgi:pantetheine-phosphate adenylyltransferase
LTVRETAAYALPSLSPETHDTASLCMTRTGFYSGSFDPVTLGHTDVIRRACALVDRLVIGIGVNPGKAPLFTDEERVAMLKAEVAPITQDTGTRIEIVTFSGLAVAAARKHGARVIVRGLRDGTDFDYEMQMAGMNNQMAPEIETIFVSASPAVRHIAANLVRAIATMDGDPTAFVSPSVAASLKAKVKKDRA